MLYFNMNVGATLLSFIDLEEARPALKPDRGQA